MNDIPPQRLLTILLYHGVTNVPSFGIENHSGKHCGLENFAAQMSYVREKCNVLSIHEVVEHYLNKHPFPENAVAVSFDDGFRNNVTVAAPILKGLQIPAVFYLSTGFIGTGKMFWVDRLEDCINRCKIKSITVDMGGEKKTLSLSEPVLKIETLTTIKNYCKNTNNADKDRIINLVSEATGIRPEIKLSENYMIMNWDDVNQLNADPLFTIGGHSVNHNILTALPDSEMQREILKSIDELKVRLKQNIEHFSYPEGQSHHYNSRVIGFLKDMGVVCCPSAIDGTNTLDDDLFHLKRIMVGFNGRPFPFELKSTKIKIRKLGYDRRY